MHLDFALNCNTLLRRETQPEPWWPRSLWMLHLTSRLTISLESLDFRVFWVKKEEISGPTSAAWMHSNAWKERNTRKPIRQRKKNKNIEYLKVEHCAINVEAYLSACVGGSLDAVHLQLKRWYFLEFKCWDGFKNPQWKKNISEIHSKKKKSLWNPECSL